jgi:N-acyl homoserine lactone hydrolase
MLFVGDLTYDLEKLTAGRVPGVGERRALLESTQAVKALNNIYPDLVILAAHDPASSRLLGQALQTSLAS